MKIFSPRFLMITATLTALAGCMKMGPDFHPPELDVKIPENFQHAPQTATVPEPLDKWWRVFGDSEIDRIVQEALENNLDIKKASAAVLQMRARFIQTRADRFPQINLQGEIQRQKISKSNTSIGGMPGFSFGGEFTNAQFSVPASFEVDLWGRLARAEEAARADLLRSEINRHTIAQSIVAEAVNLYLRMESIERRIRISQESIDSFTRSLEFVENRYQRGLTSSLDVRQARRVLAQAEAVLPSLIQELGTVQQELGVLLGRYPRTRYARLQPQDYFKMLPPVPPGLPSELLLRRPDIQAAEAQLMAASARIGAAKASRFPRITLTGNFGYSTTALEKLLAPESQLWNMSAGIVQPLFDAGKLKAVQKEAEALYHQDLADYAKTVLNAFAEVERALLTRKEQLRRRDRTLKLVKEARAAQRVAELRYQRGLTDYLNVLDAQRTRFIAEDELVQVELAILTNRVNLYRALGGSWDELPPVPSEFPKRLLEYFPP